LGFSMALGLGLGLYRPGDEWKSALKA